MRPVSPAVDAYPTDQIPALLVHLSASDPETIGIAQFLTLEVIRSAVAQPANPDAADPCCCEDALKCWDEKAALPGSPPIRASKEVLVELSFTAELESDLCT